MRYALLACLFALPFLAGCHFATDREEAQLKQRDQLIANLQADVYEAALAADKGTDVHMTSTAIRVSAVTTIQALGFTYLSGETWAKSLQTSPAPVGPVPYKAP